jgi:imidazolonepropionase-like amidohydrolase
MIDGVLHKGADVDQKSLVPGWIAVLVGGLIVGLGPQPAQTGSRGPTTAGTLAIRNVSVIPMTRDTVIRGVTVVVRDGRIERLQPAHADVPRGARTLDGQGRFLIPGLADMHVHLFADGATVHDSAASAELGVMLANGVTTARLMIGTPQHLPLRDDVRQGRVLGPKLWVASPHVNDRDEENAYLVKTPDEARDAVRRAAEAGYDFVKITFVTRPLYDAVIDEARARRIRVVGHVDPDVGLARALETGEQLEHLDSYFEALLADSSPMKQSITQYNVFRDSAWRSLDFIDDAKIARVAGMTARSGAVIGPTQNVFNTAFAKGESDSTIRSRPDWETWPPALRDGYMRSRTRYWSAASQTHRTEQRRKRFVDVRNRMLKALHDSGATIIAGSDTPEWFHVYGWGLHRELQAYVEAGLRPYDALRTATVNPATYLLAKSDWGTIEPGKRADLVLLTANPLEDIRNTTRIDAVVFGGRVIERSELDAMIVRGRNAVMGTGR